MAPASQNHCSSPYRAPVEKIRFGPMRPKITEALKKTRPLGQVKLLAWPSLQTLPESVIAQFLGLMPG